MNILPFPAFDGGRVFFILVEKIKGSPVNSKFENVCHTIGFVLLMLLMIFVTFNDIWGVIK
jgi:regulator of sigma E protease